MSLRFFSHEEIQQGIPGADRHRLLYTVSGPVPAPLLVWLDPETTQPLIRLTNMTPLSWEPFSMMISASLDDQLIRETLRPGDRCVLAWGGHDIMRASRIANLDLPRGLDMLQIARLEAVPSPYGPVPHIAQCPLNSECHVDKILDYHGYRTYWLVVDYLSLDEDILPLPREVVLQRYHLYEVDRITTDIGERLYLGMAGALYTCPTFPVGPKQGWYSTFPKWIRELWAEGYLSSKEKDIALSWHKDWLEHFKDLHTAKRARLRDRLTRLCTALCWRDWSGIHALFEEDG